MTDKEIKKLSRQELLEMLIQQAQENNRLQTELEEAEVKIQSRDIDIKDAGTIAEAAFVLNHVYEATDAAAKQYLENVKRNSELQQAEYERIVEEAQEKAAQIISEAEQKSANVVAEAEAERKRQLRAAYDYWQQVSKKLEDFYEAHQGLRELLAVQTGKRQK